MVVAVLTAWLPIYFGPLGDWVKEHPPQFIAWMKNDVTLAVVLLMAATALVVWLSIPKPATPRTLDDLVTDLADAVAERWLAEEKTLQLQAPWPLPVRWMNTARSVADHWEAINGAPDQSEPVDLSGQLHRQANDGDIAAVFGRVVSRRLVILGEPGAGKTVLALSLVLKLLDQRQDGDPVPVLLSVGSWDPERESLHAWMARRLGEDDPRLRARSESQPTLAWELIKAGWVLPVLDGLDEIPSAARRTALVALNRALKRGEPLVVTCRAKEYEQAVKENVLIAAAVVELCPLDQPVLQKYLQVTTPPRQAGKWDEVFAELEDHPDGPVARALTTPLMAWLARTAYAGTGARPATLVASDDDGNRRFADQTAVENHLLGRFVPAVYSSDLSEEGSREWASEDAHRWLSFLAWHLRRLGADGVAWWEIGTTMRRSSRMVVVGLVAGLLFGLIVWLVDGLMYVTGGLGLTPGFVFVNGLMNGAEAALICGLAHGIWPRLNGDALKPSRVRIRIRGWERTLGPRTIPRLLGGLGLGLAVGLMDGLVTGLGHALMFDRVPWLMIGLVDAVYYGLVLGGGASLVLGATAWFEAPIDTTTATSPAGLLNTNRTTVLFQALALGPVFGIVAGFGRWFVADLFHGYLWGVTLEWGFTDGLRYGFQLGLGGWLAAGLSLTAWGQWVVLARIWLPLTGRLPWAVSAFLKDAHRRGVLRQSGAYYQFRHARLQSHLQESM
ncbi:NACHT domain-containing protein [Streptomyces sp. NPDC048637]|uniref:NACHT domain-containing protein n=1 Tax=Streptomyces sp. NPDC048637 TaxID=3155636 RepID=UPI003414F91C